MDDLGRREHRGVEEQLEDVEGSARGGDGAAHGSVLLSRRCTRCRTDCRCVALGRQRARNGRPRDRSTPLTGSGEDHYRRTTSRPAFGMSNTGGRGERCAFYGGSVPWWAAAAVASAPPLPDVSSRRAAGSSWAGSTPTRYARRCARWPTWVRCTERPGMWARAGERDGWSRRPCPRSVVSTCLPTTLGPPG